MIDNVRLTSYRPGAIGWLVGLHGAYYHEHWDFGLFFEAWIARDMGEFLLRFDPECDGFWLAEVDGTFGGSIAIDGIHAETQGAHLRWFIVDPELQGRGIGRRLLSEAVAFCRERHYNRIYLWTFAGLDAARRLYEAAGFKLVDEFVSDQRGSVVTEQRFELDLSGEALSQ